MGDEGGGGTGDTVKWSAPPSTEVQPLLVPVVVVVGAIIFGLPRGLLLLTGGGGGMEGGGLIPLAECPECGH